MQTFLPYPDFAESARVLDVRRLGKQRVEALQILRELDRSTPPTRWSNHPAVRMWRGYEATLVTYGVSICDEWIGRGYRDTCREKIIAAVLTGDIHDFIEPSSAPPWLGDTAFHQSHRSNLVRKLPAHYGVLWPDVPDDLPYVWPVPLNA